MWEKTWQEMRRKEGRSGKHAYEDVSIREPHTHYEEFPKILDANGDPIDIYSEPDASEYTMQAKIMRTLLTEKNDVPDPLYLQENVYFIFFKEELPFINTLYEVLWHKHIGEEGVKPDFYELHDTDQGVMTIENIETHKGSTRIVCQLHELA